jgi:hypothetical protein
VRITGSATYLRDRARKRGGRSLFLTVAGVVLIVAGFAAAQTQQSSALLSGFPGFLGFGALLFGFLQASAGRRDAEAANAEAPVLNQLSARLSDDYLYLRGVRLPGQRLEADVIVLGPHGALVLGLFGAPGSFTVRRDDWFEDGGSLRDSPSWALTRRLRTLQRLAREEGLTEIPVHGAVVLVRGELVNAEQPSVAVVPLNRIASYVEHLRPADAEALKEPVQTLAAALEPYAAGGSGRRATSEDDGR